jgi:hypothetical protein
VSGEARVTDVLGLRSKVDSVKTLQHFHARPILFRADISPQSCDAAGRAWELPFHLGKQSLGDIQLTHAPQSTANVFEKATICLRSLYEERKGRANSPCRHARLVNALDLTVPYSTPLGPQSVEVAGQEELRAA